MRKTCKKVLSLFLALVLCLGLVPVGAFAAEPTSGTCGADGDNVTWTLENGVLTIKGTGRMKYYGFYSPNPWENQRDTITSIVIGDGITNIEDMAFAYHKNLINVTIPNSVTSIGDYVFEYCTSLTSVTIPSSVTSIGERAFEGCKDLTSATIHGNIGEYAFLYCTGLSSVIIGGGVTSIGSHAFDSCTNLTSVSIPSSVTSIGWGAFEDCTSLTSVTIPGSIKSIGTDAFDGCTNLTTAGPIGRDYYNIEYGWSEIPDNAFRDSFSSLTSVTIGNDVTSIGNGAFFDCKSLTSVTISDSVTSIGDYAFSGCTGLNSVDFGNGVTSIGRKSFYCCSGLNSVTIPNSVSSIGEEAFNGCTGLTSVTIGSGVTSFEGYAFANCTDLRSVVIGNGVTSIGDWAFVNCTSLTSMTIPSSVTSIGSKAFRNCTGLTDVYFTGTEAQWRQINIHSDNDVLTSATIHCNGTGPDSGTDPTELQETFFEVHQFKMWDVFTNTVYFHDGTSYPLYSDNSSIKMDAVLNQWVECTLKRTADGVRLEQLKVVKPLMVMDVKITLDSRMIEYSGRKLRFEDGEFEGKAKFGIPITVTVTNRTTVTGASQAALKQSEALAITLNDLEINLESGFNQGGFRGGKVAVKNPVTLKVGESWTSEQGYIRVGTWFKPESIQNEYHVSVIAKTSQGEFANNAKYSITNLDIQNKSVSNLASKAGSELKQINTKEFAISSALPMMYDLGFDSKSLDTFKREIIAQIVMSNAPKKSFQQKVSDKVLSEVFGYKKDLGVSTYDLPLTYIIKSPKYGNVKLKLTCHIQEYDLQGTTFGDVINIKYEILQPSSQIKAKDYKSGQFGAINKADVKAFSDAAYNLVEAELKNAFDTGWGNRANEVAELIFGKTVTAILDKCGTNYSDLTWKLSTWPYKSVSVRCPVDVFVYDEFGQLCGAIENNKVTKSSDAFELLVVDDDKHILGLENGYNVKYVATDNGTMSVEVTEFASFDDPMQVVMFHEVPLTTDKEYSQDIPETILADAGAYELTSDSGQTIQADETRDLLEAVTESSVTFTDVPADSWYNDAVYWAVEQGITAGTGTNPPTFSPERTCTETEILTFLWRAAGQPDSAVQLPFTPKNSWAEDALRWAYEKGMIGATFNESTPCTRASTAKFIWQAAGAPSASGSTFTDVPASADYAQAVAWAVAQGITQGTGNGAFSPNKTCTRAEIVTFLYRGWVAKS